MGSGKDALEMIPWIPYYHSRVHPAGRLKGGWFISWNELGVTCLAQLWLDT